MADSKERDFYGVVVDLDEGLVHQQLTQKLRELVKAVCDTGKSGTMTFKVKAKLDGRNVIITSDVRSSPPQPATGSTFFFPDEKGDLRREDPKQPQLRNLDTKPPTQLRRVPEAEAQKKEA
jgi:hypothetical protein